jgi:hypothetical protein
MHSRFPNYFTDIDVFREHLFWLFRRLGLTFFAFLIFFSRRLFLLLTTWFIFFKHIER